MKRLVVLLVGMLAIVVVPEFVSSVANAGYPVDPATVDVNPISPFVGDPVTFTATNFAPFTTVDFTVSQPGSGPVVTSLTADAAGTASVVTTASLTAGAASVQATSATPLLAAIANFTIQPLAVTTTTGASTTTTIGATSTTAVATTTTAAATTTTAGATTTTAGATTTTIAAATTTVAPATTSAATTTIAAATTTTVATPAVTPSNPTPTPGADITINAAGFIPGSTVNFEITGDFGTPANAQLRPQVDTTKNLGSSVADANGVASKTFKAPERPGQYVVKATSGEKSATTVITVKVLSLPTTAVSAVAPNAPPSGLPTTGTETTTWVRIAALLLVVGTGCLVVAATRRKPRIVDR